MVKIPQNAEHAIDDEAIERRTQFLHDLGVLVYQWNATEIYIEMAIRRLTGLSNLHCSILLGGLQHKAKTISLYALLRENGESEAISKMKTAMSYAKRNALMHGVTGSEADMSKFSVFHRSVDDRYRVATHNFTAESFHDHVWEFCRLVDNALKTLGIDVDAPETKQALSAYAKDARFEGID
jgi:hypothetical protein